MSYKNYLAIENEELGMSNKENKTLIAPQVAEQLEENIFSIPWGHHRLLIDKFLGQPQKALFFVRQTIQNGWSRDMLLNFVNTDLYESVNLILLILDSWGDMWFLVIIF